MSSRPSRRRIAVVAGDVTIDWNLAHAAAGPESAPWHAEDACQAYRQAGSAALLADLLEACVGTLPVNDGTSWVVQRANGGALEADAAASLTHSYALWSAFPYATGVRGEPPVWRLHQHLGLHRPRVMEPSGGEPAEPGTGSETAGDEVPLVVLEDTALGFRERPSLWPHVLRGTAQPTVILKMSRPIATGQLWEQLVQEHADRLIVVMTANDVRRSDVQISRALSWEQTAQDVLRELVYNPRINSLAACAHVVVSFGADAAFLLSGRAGRLIFDPATAEGEWGVEHPGSMIGYTTCLVGGIARQFMLTPEAPDLGAGVRSGIEAMRVLHREGFGVRGTVPGEAALGFPAQRVAEALGQMPDGLGDVPVPDPAVPLTPRDRTAGAKMVWTILEDQYRGDLGLVAERIVVEGDRAALASAPVARFGKLVTADRQEIESYRAIAARIRGYTRRSDESRPLSLAVFGPAGAGKSFGIKQIAEMLLPGRIQVLEFNLSQLDGPAALLDALHQVRDVGLAGKIPLAFWDEFDTTVDGQRLAWLRHFLAPMWDGQFQHGQIVHRIGRAIFVFAGSTSATLDGFGSGMAEAERKAAKVDDFVSRLSGYVNVLGPNRLDAPGRADRFFLIRRALILRSLLLRRAPWLFRRRDGKQVPEIDPGVLRALLHTRAYRHGARSMEAILTMSALEGNPRYDRSALPPDAQLGLHVDAADFGALVHQLVLDDTLVERLAEDVHEYFCERRRAEGYQYGPQTDPVALTHSSLVPFADLPDDEQQQNRGLVRDIPAKLAAAGYAVTAARGTPPAEFPEAVVERLAELEHTRWLKAKVGAGWRCVDHPPADVQLPAKELQLHQDIRPWRRFSDEEMKARYTGAELDAMCLDELSAEAKEKDRELVRAIARILGRAGYTIVKVEEDLFQNATE